MEPNKKRLKSEIDFLLGTTEHRTLHVDDKKLILTEGGFVIDEEVLAAEKRREEEITVTEPPPELEPEDYPRCIECETRFISSFLLKSFEYSVCDPCREDEEKFDLIPKSAAKEEYLLKDCDLDRREPTLKFISKPNPHNPMGHDMKLYLRIQVVERAINVWGSLEGLEQEREKRAEKREKTKVKKFNKEMKKLRMSVRSSEYTKNLEGHKHEYGVETYDEDNDIYRKNCISCGHVIEYEKM
ncbi:DNA repair protein complementing XP-A cells homolog [Artemia franciscana]|uniref:XPA C-terminal domain-containing protein n=1 Tax=Artemia franciscana TaxID=6661 RepID=A0AA88HPE3_ARTSF|nr:hypothetical protein QYM36_009115 [Artemia franciscana]